MLDARDWNKNKVAFAIVSGEYLRVKKITFMLFFLYQGPNNLRPQNEKCQ
jgi:hypothetical protein